MYSDPTGFLISFFHVFFSFIFLLVKITIQAFKNGLSLVTRNGRWKFMGRWEHSFCCLIASLDGFVFHLFMVSAQFPPYLLLSAGCLYL
ncbi:hypothetical protein L873DRAFT_996340 [Choiromyces venosus 120613-1]|uniref:Uncharacterized protein n=1 Tax=Choiromyces venosus 120613-1 TaxID=1336337 RepID=A0A3N4JKY8_9PEZI|nr:hypothetical protein L873DRAFT_996340 [Choiromyces venosus 120613-1]